MLFGKRINKYYIKHIFAYIIGITFLIAIDYVQALIPEQVAKLAGGVENSNFTIELVKSVVLTILVYGVIITISRFIWRIALIGSARKIEKELKDEMFEHSQKLSQEYYSNQKVGAIMSLYTSDIETVRQSLGFGIVIFIDAVFLGLVAVIKMLQVNVLLTLVSLIPMFFIGFGGIWFSKSFVKSYLKRQEAYEGLSDFTQENFSGISVIKAYVKERRELKDFVKKNKNVFDASMGFIKKSALLESIIESLIALSVILIFALGGYLAYKGELTGAKVFEFYQLFFLLIWPMIALAQIINSMSQGKASLKRITEYLETPITVKDSDSVITDIEDLNGDILFNNLTFNYPNTEVGALNNISIKINNGDTVGFIGKTGCGKSTLVELLLRTYNLEEDKLYIGGYDIMKLPIKLVRKNIGYVPQNNFLFSDTVSNNIAFGVETATETEIKQAALLADIDQNIMDFKDGYKTVVGERGTTLSGGQKQRISIARALLKNPNILILDDSVSAVDTKTEVTILKNLKKVRKGKTTLIIGHRISTMKTMDKIVLLDDGKIVGFGSHKELAKTSKLYQQMIKEQELED